MKDKKKHQVAQSIALYNIGKVLTNCISRQLLTLDIEIGAFVESQCHESDWVMLPITSVAVG